MHTFSTGRSGLQVDHADTLCVCEGLLLYSMLCRRMFGIVLLNYPLTLLGKDVAWMVACLSKTLNIHFFIDGTITHIQVTSVEDDAAFFLSLADKNLDDL